MGEHQVHKRGAKAKRHHLAQKCAPRSPPSPYFLDLPTQLPLDHHRLLSSNFFFAVIAAYSSVQDSKFDA
jgi:hypothetical protein